MMTSENYTTPRKYKVDTSDGHLFHKDSERSEVGSFYDERVRNATDSTDYCTPESADIEASSSNGKRSERSRHRRSKDHAAEEVSPRNSEEVELEGATAQVSDKPKSLKKEKASGKKRKERKNLREKRRSTGVVIMPGAANDDQESEARQTLENTKQNENIGAEAFTPSPTEVSSSNHARSSRTARDGADADKHDKQDLIDRLEKLEKSLEQKTKEVETLKTENQRLRDENNALIRVVNQVSSLKIK